jgi:hypothetical protein
MAVAMGLAAALNLSAAEFTAYQLVKEGNSKVADGSKDRVVQIRSEKSVAGIVPATWYVVYYDEYASLKAVEVKFVGGRVVKVDRPARLFEAMADKHTEMDPKRMKIDSDKALKIAMKEDALVNLKVTASQLKLERYEEVPVWKITLWVAKVNKPAKEVKIGEIFVSADDGKVVKLDVKPEKAG